MEVIMSSPVQECSEMKVDKGGNGPVKLINKEKKTSTHELGLKRWKESQKEKLASDGNLSRAKESQKEKLASYGNLGRAIESQKEKPASDGSLSKANKKKRKRKSMKTSTTLDDILSADESPKDTKKSLEALSSELKTKDHPKTANVEKGPSTDTVLAKTATTDKKMLVSSSAGITGDERSSILQSSFKDKAYSDIGATGNLNVEVKVENQMETVVGEKGSGKNSTYNSASKKRKKKREKKNPESRTTATVDQNSSVLTSSATGAEKSLISKVETSSGEMGLSKITNVNAEVKIENKMETTVGETGSGTNETDNTVSNKRKRARKKKLILESDDVLSTLDYTKGKTTTSSEEKSSISRMEIDKGNDAVKLTKSQSLDKREDTENIKGKTQIQSISLSLVQDNPFSGIGSTATDNTSSKTRKRKPKKKNSPVSGDVLSTGEYTQVKIEDKTETVVGETGSGTKSTDKSTSKKRKKREKKNPESDTTATVDQNSSVLTSSATGAEKSLTIENKMETTVAETGLGTNETDNTVSEKRKSKKLNKKVQASVGILSTNECTQDTNESLEALSTELKTEDHSKTANLDKGSSTMLKVYVCRKKLVIFDVNGFLADFVYPPLPKDMIADFGISKQAVFKRPFLDEFLSFCFERFHVGIWSSRTMQILDPVVNFLLGDSKKKLLFLWDASKCTNSGMRTLEDRHKHLVLKDLRKIWERDGPRGSWVRGNFNDTNTLLLDDSPYTALVNPKHSGIFPVSYSCKNKDDNFLGPNGELQNYLEGLASCDDVKTYVEQHPFGQAAIDERHPQWYFYARVLKSQTR